MVKLKLTTKVKMEMTISANLICSIFNGLGIRRNRMGPPSAGATGEANDNK
jgi:hypothetical protein